MDDRNPAVEPGGPELFWKAASDLLCVLDAEGRMARVNPAWSDVLGWPQDELVGVSPLRFVHPEDVEHAAAGFGAQDRAAFECRQLADDGSHRVVAWAVRREGGCVAAIGRDVSEAVVERRRLEDELERMWETHVVARLSTWEWEPAADHVSLWTRLGEELGVDVAPGFRLAALVALVVERHRADVEAAVRDVLADGRQRTIRYEVDDRSGGTLWFQSQMRRVADGPRFVVRGTTQDVTPIQAAEDVAAVTRGFWQAILDSLTAEVAVLDEGGLIVAVNEAWLRHAHAAGEAQTHVGSNFLDACDEAGRHDPVAREIAQSLRDIAAGRRSTFAVEYAVHGADEECWTLLRGTPYYGAGPVRVVVSRQDVTERRRADARTALQARLLDEVDAAVVAVDLDATITHWNAAAHQMYGWRADEVLGRTLYELAGEAAGGLREVLELVLEAGRWEQEADLRRSDGSPVRSYVRAATIEDAAGAPMGIVSVSVDVTARAEAERRLRGARDFLRAVTQEMGEGLLTLDIAGCVTHMNAAAERMLGWRAAELVGRAVHEVLEPSHPLDEAGRRLDEVFRRRDGTPLPVSYTVSTFLTEDGVRGVVVVFSDISERKARERELMSELDTATWVGRIRDALAEDRFVLYAQPIVDVRTREVIRHELLLRMVGRLGEIVAPSCFLPVAEESGLVRDIDRFVVRRAVELAAAGRAVELNLSAAGLGDPDLLREVEREIERTGADPGLLVFEITETALIGDEVAAQAFIERVDALGCSVALDDFGTGYGGFSYLKRLPVDYLKIDAEFVRDLSTAEASRHVVAAVITLARGFGQQTVAEGVEDEMTLQLLTEMGVDYAQGYVLGHPVPLDEAWPD